MRIKLQTVVDITNTNARRSDDKKAYSQQCNYNTVLQTIGLRVNLEPGSCETSVSDISNLGFGNNITGKQRLWTFTFNISYEGALNKEMLENDFDLVPVITELDETAFVHNNIFRTTCPNDCNIVFDFENI